VLGLAIITRNLKQKSSLQGEGCFSEPVTAPAATIQDESLARCFPRFTPACRGRFRGALGRAFGRCREGEAGWFPNALPCARPCDAVRNRPEPSATGISILLKDTQKECMARVQKSCRRGKLPRIFVVVAGGVVYRAHAGGVARAQYKCGLPLPA
jgi:hypothetical protein